MIYFDNAATTFPKPPRVADAMVRALGEFGGPSRGSHAFALAAGRCLEQARDRLAALFRCPRPERIAFAKNATEALNLAIASVDGHIVSSEAEHNSVLRPLYRRGNFSLVPVDALGRFSAEDVAAACRPDTAAVVLAHASNFTGNVVPLAEIGRLCRERDMLFVVDAAQTAGLLDIDMEGMAVDALCFSGHKSLYGPQGTGGICLGERFAARPLLVGGSGSRTFSPEQPEALPELLEAGTANAHGIAGLSAGVEYVGEAGPANLLRRANRLAAMFAEGAARLKGATLYGDLAAAERVPVVSLNLGRLDSAEVAGELDARYGIAVRAGGHCAPLLHRRFGTERQGAVRFSFSHFNTEEEIGVALRALEEMEKT